MGYFLMAVRMLGVLVAGSSASRINLSNSCHDVSTARAVICPAFAEIRPRSVSKDPNAGAKASQQHQSSMAERKSLLGQR